MTVLRRWAIVTEVQPSWARSSASWTTFKTKSHSKNLTPQINLDVLTICTFSDSVSSAEVASSSRRIAGFLTRALAMATRCFWPPESWAPLSPTLVS